MVRSRSSTAIEFILLSDFWQLNSVTMGRESSDLVLRDYTPAQVSAITPCFLSNEKNALERNLSVIGPKADVKARKLICVAALEAVSKPR